MVAPHIHDALRQVEQLRNAVLEKRQFRGYSGLARMLSGITALAMAAILAAGPASAERHLAGWGIVLLAGLSLNYGAMLHWFLRDPQVGRNPAYLQPALDALPPLAVGAVLSGACLWQWDIEVSRGCAISYRELSGAHPGQWNLDLLFTVWMCLYGLTHIPYRHSLPPANYAVGLFYIAAGTACLACPGVHFLNPWPMGLVFFAGEMAGGIILHRDQGRRSPGR